MNASAAEFHLLESSPAMEHVSADPAPVDDFDGRSRPQEPSFDLGTFEWDAAGMIFSDGF